MCWQRSVCMRAGPTDLEEHAGFRVPCEQPHQVNQEWTLVYPWVILLPDFSSLSVFHSCVLPSFLSFLLLFLLHSPKMGTDLMPGTPASHLPLDHIPSSFPEVSQCEWPKNWRFQNQKPLTGYVSHRPGEEPERNGRGHWILGLGQASSQLFLKTFSKETSP